MTALVILTLLQVAQSTPKQQFDRLAARAGEARKASRDTDALRLYQSALQLKPSWTDGWWNVGSILYEREDFPAARDALRKLTALDKKAVAAYALLGICEYKVADYDAALEHLDTARSLGLPANHPLGNAALFFLALLLNREGQHDAAAGLLLSAPENDVAFLVKGSSPAVLVAIGMTGLGIAKLPEELTPVEKDLAAQVGRAMAAPESEAAALMRDLLARHPDRPNLHYLYGMVLLHGDSGIAIEQFQKELDRDPRHVPALLAIVRELERQSQFQEALRYAQRAVTAEPGNYAAHAILGRVLVSLDRTEEGLRELEQAREIEPGSPQIYFALASAYAKLGRNDDARKARAEFLRLKNLGSAKP
jgi:tetratricopeptide (TPR) repeat protein